MSETERQCANRLLAKAIAYQDCGKQATANEYGRALVMHLGQCGIDCDSQVKSLPIDLKIGEQTQ